MRCPRKPAEPAGLARVRASGDWNSPLQRMFLYSSMGLSACTSTESRCINEQMFFLEAGPAIATLLFAGFVAFFLSWTKNKNFTLRFVQVVAFLFLAWSLASLTATLVR